MIKKIMSFIILIISLILVPILPVTASENSNEKIIYLTFDDGPSNKIMPNILDTLKKEQVNATFFIIGDQIKGNEKILKRVHEEGHSIGLHSVTHKKCNLYSSNDCFLKEMLKDQKLINEVVGISPTILRFPYGANNDTYKLTKSMVDLLHKNNLKIYDWNLDSGDGANHNLNPSTYIKNSKSNKDMIILLMHCGNMNKNTANALPEIISYYKSKGYTFRKIDETTPEYFKIRK
ncbi:polysaccharide deacetylase family protein [Clostridium sp.]|uniref:polysaccharide deacetylase family protein n=1 Tax=Clostridium sp. TaxID=1506 RepID=UPI002A9135FF|nr:polysaccharide deacetylase family protein [Clostridium sp.]MDY6012553.1 polysaccharide deacetylase family protein [Clostridium sp.]